MLFSDKLYSILSELQQRHRSRHVIMEQAVKDRLNNSLVSYVKSLDDSVTYLSARDDINMLKRLSRGN